MEPVETPEPVDVGTPGASARREYEHRQAKREARIRETHPKLGTRANIDHIAVTPTGIYVIDAKKHQGRPSLKVEGGILRPRAEKLLVGTRNQTKPVDGVLTQVDVVRAIVGDDLPVTGVLCYIEADWPLIGGAFTIRGVEVLLPRTGAPSATPPDQRWSTAGVAGQEEPADEGRRHA